METEVHGKARLKPTVRKGAVKCLTITYDDIAALADQRYRAVDSLALG